MTTRLESTWSSEKGLNLKEVDFSLEEVDFSLEEVDFSLKEVDIPEIVLGFEIFKIGLDLTKFSGFKS